MCDRCSNGVDFEKGVKLKGAPKVRSNVAFSFEELYSMYNKFESQRISKAEKLTGKKNIKPDHLIKFIVERTNFCPHKLIDSTSSYWFETVMMLDGEMGLTLPGEMEEIPSLFFDALTNVRSGRALARSEEKKD